MSENPPKPLSRGKERKVARELALEADLDGHTQKSIEKAKEARRRAKYVERGPLQRSLERGLLESLVPNANLKKYDKEVFESAPIDETQNLPATGPGRRKAAREYSRTHNLSGQIQEEQKRLEKLRVQTKRLKTGPVTRAVIGRRTRKYESALFAGATTKEGIQESLEQAKEEKLSFHPPVPGKIIEVETDPATEGGDSSGLRREIPRAYPEAEPPQTEIPPERQATAPAYSAEQAQEIGDAEDQFDDSIEEHAAKVLLLEERPSKEKKNFFKELDRRTRLLFPEALVNRDELRDGFVAGENVTESELIFAMMDFYRTKFDETTELGREMIYQATLESLREAKRERQKTLASQALPPTRGRVRVRVDTNQKRRNDVRTGKKKQRFPWFKTLGTIAGVLLAGWGASKALEEQQERITLEQALDELDEPTTSDPLPAEPGYTPAPRISMTEAAQEVAEDVAAGRLTPLSQMTPEQERVQARANPTEEPVLRQYGEAE